MVETEIYVPKAHLIRPHGLIDAQDAGVQVKLYTMVPEDSTDFEKAEVEHFGRVIGEHFRDGALDKKLGLGFSVMSVNVFNICMWGGEYPSLLNQSLYAFEQTEQGLSWHRESVDDVGTFCCWELGVVSHEGEAWRRYLFSRQSQQDREEYLANRFSGRVE